MGNKRSTFAVARRDFGTAFPLKMKQLLCEVFRIVLHPSLACFLSLCLRDGYWWDAHRASALETRSLLKSKVCGDVDHVRQKRVTKIVA